MSGPAAFMYGLRDLGYVEGRNIVIERRSDGGRPEHMPALMKELVGHPVDVIVTAGSGAQDAQRATDMIPIVVRIDDAVSTGLTAGLARPSGNITGVTSTAGPAIHGKGLQRLKEATPTSTRFAVVDFKYVDSRETPGTHVRRFESEAAARVLADAHCGGRRQTRGVRARLLDHHQGSRRRTCCNWHSHHTLALIGTDPGLLTRT